MRNTKALWPALLAMLLVAACGRSPEQENGTRAQSTPAVASENAVSSNQDKGLIPRELLFGNPQRSTARLSPDGKHLGWLAPDKDVLNVYVSPASDPESAKVITHDTSRGIRRYFWAYDNQHIIYLQDRAGDENWRAYSVDIDTGEENDLTPIEGVNAQIQDVSAKHPNEILVGLNDRDPSLHDIYRVNIDTGDRELVEKNEQGFLGYVTDDDYNVRVAMQMQPDGGIQYLKKNDAGEWTPWFKVEQQDTLATGPVGFDSAGDTFYMLDSRGRNTAALVAMDMATGKSKVLHEDERADVSDVTMDPVSHQPQAVAVDYLKKGWDALGAPVKEDIAYLSNFSDGELDIHSRTLDDSEWVVGYEFAEKPYTYYLYDRNAKQASFLFTTRPGLQDRQLAGMDPVVIKSRDGLNLVSYLTLPYGSDPDDDGRPSDPLPMVLFVHGGPWARDEWGYNPYHQWLADRGYAVLSVNYRGSTGLGKDFVNAGDKQWAAKMHDDLIDAVQWAEHEHVTTSGQVAIMGGSYGGYATLVGLTFTPDEFACGVDIVGPSNLVTLLNSIPPYWKPMMDLFATRVGDPRTEAGKELLTERSPLTRAGAIRKPLLIGQGANDPRVKQAESDQIVKAMEDKGIPVTYVLFPDEGHGFARPENRLAFNAVAESFLGNCLGGKVQPVGNDFEGSSIQVPEGAGNVPGLVAALKANNSAKAADGEPDSSAQP